jgi:hypothetical protein
LGLRAPVQLVEVHPKIAQRARHYYRRKEPAHRLLDAAVGVVHQVGQRVERHRRERWRELHVQRARPALPLLREVDAQRRRLRALDIAHHSALREELLHALDEGRELHLRRVRLLVALRGHAHRRGAGAKHAPPTGHWVLLQEGLRAREGVTPALHAAQANQHPVLGFRLSVTGRSCSERLLIPRQGLSIGSLLAEAIGLLQAPRVSGRADRGDRDGGAEQAEQQHADHPSSHDTPSTRAQSSYSTRAERNLFLPTGVPLGQRAGPVGAEPCCEGAAEGWSTPESTRDHAP